MYDTFVFPLINAYKGHISKTIGFAAIQTWGMRIVTNIVAGYKMNISQDSTLVSFVPLLLSNSIFFKIKGTHKTYVSMSWSFRENKNIKDLLDRGRCDKFA